MVRQSILDEVCAQLSPNMQEELRKEISFYEKLVDKIESHPPMSKHHYDEYMSVCKNKAIMSYMYIAGMPDETAILLKRINSW